MTATSEFFLRRGALALAGALIAGALAPAAAFAQVETPRVRFSLGWLFQATQAHFTLAADRGYYKAEGLDVTVDRGAGSGASIQRVIAGSHELAYTDIGTLAKYNAENPGKEVIAVYVAEDGYPLAIFAPRGKGIATPKDLEGKRIAAPTFDGARQMFPAFAKANGIDPAKINWQTVDAQLREPMLVRGEADAISGFITSGIPTLAALGLKGDNLVVMRYSQNNLDGFGNAIIATREFAEKNPRTVAAFVRAANKGLRDMIAEPRAAIDSLKQRDPLVNVDTETERMQIVLSEGSVLTPNVKQNGLSSVDPKRLERAVAAVLDAYNLKVALPNDRVYTDRFLPPRAERMLR
jgi:NitT/TauT family transport system substrate-binding protein